MTDAEKAYEIAEQRIARAKAEGLAYLCLARFPDPDDPANWDEEEALDYLATLPPSISSLTEVKRLDLYGTQVTDLSPLAGMKAIQTLYLSDTHVTDLSPLAGMAEMQTLYLTGTQVTDLSPLAGMEAMQTLHLRDTQVTDLSPLTGMAAMEALWLNGTPVTDLSPLAGMAEMQRLYLNGTQVTDLSPLAGMAKMRELTVHHTKVSDISALVGLEELEILRIDSTRVSDLSPLSAMTKMRSLSLHSTMVTDLSPLGAMSGLEQLFLNHTNADLSSLVAPGAAWEVEDRNLVRMAFKSVPVSDAKLAEIGEKGLRAPEALTRLRELRGMTQPRPPQSEPSPHGPHTFLSYASDDRPTASRLKSALEAEGLAIWWDQMIDPGADWDAELRRRLTASHSVLVLWSDASAASDHVRDEAQRARRANTLASVKISDLPDDDLPLAFGMRHAPDLSHWDGSREDEAFRRLVTFLKQRQAGADSPLTVEADEDGALRLRERPVGAAPEREDDVTRDRLIAAQVKLAERTAEQAKRAPNAPPDLPDRLGEYAEELKAEGEKFWEVIDDAFAPAAGLLKPEEMTDDGLADAARRLLVRHRDLRAYIQPMQPPDQPPRKDEVEPDAAEAIIPELRATRELASHPDLPKIGPAIPRVLETAAEHIEEEVQSFPMNDAEAEQRRTRVGRAVQNAKGVAAGLATAMTYHSYGVSDAGKALLGKLGDLIDKLVDLLP